MVTINDLQRLRDQAEAATDLRDIWDATVHEVALRWRIAEEPSQAPLRGEAIFLKVGAAIRDESRVHAISYIEQWRSAWLDMLRQKDHTSTASLTVIDSFRRLKSKTRITVEGK
jgi:hypothetical protein